MEKGIINTIKNQMIELEKIFVPYITNKGLKHRNIQRSSTSLRKYKPNKKMDKDIDRQFTEEL